jgi:hypothetical protein
MASFAMSITQTSTQLLQCSNTVDIDSVTEHILQETTQQKTSMILKTATRFFKVNGSADLVLITKDMKLLTTLTNIQNVKAFQHATKVILLARIHIKVLIVRM